MAITWKTGTEKVAKERKYSEDNDHCNDNIDAKHNKSIEQVDEEIDVQMMTIEIGLIGTP